jgi:hypothetical protein
MLIQMTRFPAIPSRFLPFLLLIPWVMAPGSSRAQDMLALETALNLGVFDTGFYMPLEELNDVSVDTGGGFDFDFINQNSGTHVVRPEKGFFENGRIDLLNAFLAYQGPYVTYQAGQVQTGLTPYDQGSPLDPWGSPYYFFSPLGLINGDMGTISLSLYGDDFDRYTLVSLGPDGEKSTDDLARSIGGSVTSFVIGGITGSGVATAADGLSQDVPVGQQVSIQGYNLGDTQGDGVILLNGSVVNDIQYINWSENGVSVIFPSSVAGQSGILALQRDSQVTHPVREVSLFQVVNGAGNWLVYE